MNELGIKAGNEFMQAAIDEAVVGILNGHGGPFGTVIVKDGRIVARGHNRVLSEHDASCHGEIDAIRSAGKTLLTHDLSGCVLYTTGEPCPMCLCACMWANIEKIFYGCTILDNELIGFRDKTFDDMLGGREQFGGRLEMVDREACLELFAAYLKTDRQSY